MDSRLADLERRVARAERQARALAGLVLVALSGGTIVLAARTAETRSPGSTVRAPFRVVDARGNALLVVDTGEWNDHWDAPGGTRLRLFDRNRRPTAVLMAAEDGGDLSLDREGGNRSIGLFAGGGGAALTFENPRNQGIPAAVLQAQPNGSAFILYDRSAHQAADLESSGESGRLELHQGERSVFRAP